MNLKKVIIDSVHILILKDKSAYNYDTATPLLKMVSSLPRFFPKMKCELCLLNSVWVTLGNVRTKFAPNAFSEMCYLSLFSLTEDIGN